MVLLIFESEDAGHRANYVNAFVAHALKNPLAGGLGSEHCIVADTMEALVEIACDAVDDVPRLNEMQNGLFEAAKPYLSDTANLARLREEVSRLAL